MNIAYRKRVLPLIGALLLILFLCSCAKTAPAATPEVTAAPAVSSEPAVETVVFTDPVLEAKIRADLSQPEGEITSAQAAGF